MFPNGGEDWTLNRPCMFTCERMRINIEIKSASLAKWAFKTTTTTKRGGSEKDNVGVIFYVGSFVPREWVMGGGGLNRHFREKG